MFLWLKKSKFRTTDHVLFVTMGEENLDTFIHGNHTTHWEKAQVQFSWFKQGCEWTTTHLHRGRCHHCYMVAHGSEFNTTPSSTQLRSHVYFWILSLMFLLPRPWFLALKGWQLPSPEEFVIWKISWSSCTLLITTWNIASTKLRKLQLETIATSMEGPVHMPL